MTLPPAMHGVLLTGHGGFEKLDYRTDLPVPVPAPDEVLIEVGAAGVNNTDINTRIGWYAGGGWSGPIGFPRIQGADVVGRVVAEGSDVGKSRVGRRVLVRTLQTARVGDPATDCETLGSERDGGFAQYCAVPASEAFVIESELTDVELGSFPCAYSTAEGVLHRTGVAAGDVVLVTGASGGVGSAAVQLAARRRAEVIAVASRPKWHEVAALGAARLVDRDADLVAELGSDSVDVVVDVVAGPAWPRLLELLRKQGRYGTCGAIAGPIVELDVRTLYLKDLSLYGCTHQPTEVFERLVGYIERGEVRPVVAGTHPLSEIVRAQQDFLAKDFIGKLVLVPPKVG